MREVELVIIGAGIAGLTAAAAAAREGMGVLVIERMGAGGQVMNVERIDNLPGHPAGISGYELGPLLQEQAEAAGAEFMLDEVQALAPDGARHLVHCSGETVAARAVLLACGSRRKLLGVPGENEYEGRGVSHCASCDGPLFRGQTVVVAGGGDSAFGEALVLAAHAASVKLVFPESEPLAQPYLQEAVRALPGVESMRGARVVEIAGDASGVTHVKVRGDGTGERSVPAHGIFVYAGLVPDTGLLDGLVKLDAQGRVETDARLRTSVPGIYAAGDARSGADWRLASAADEGARAAASAVHDLRAVA
jgi:thioredoxin reductase (NADPH)